MKYDVVTLFPEVINSYCSQSVVKRGIDKGIIEVSTTNPRDFTKDKHNRVDFPPYGGSYGMVLACQPMFDAVESIRRVEKSKILMMTPQGAPFTHKMSVELSEYDQLIILCGHYEGFDERIRIGLQPMEISIGDYVLTGGELPALVLIDSISRNISGFLGKDESAQFDSFADGLLEYPHYTKPREFRGMKVPEVLLNGNHQEIEKFRNEQKILRTKAKRPDLLQ